MAPNSAPVLNVTHSTPPAAVLDKILSVPSAPFRESALGLGQTRTPIAGKKRLHDSAEPSPTTISLSASPIQSPLKSPQSTSVKLSKSGADLAKAMNVAAAAEQAKLLKANMKLSNSPNGHAPPLNRK